VKLLSLFSHGMSYRDMLTEQEAAEAALDELEAKWGGVAYPLASSPGVRSRIIYRAYFKYPEPIRKVICTRAY